MPKARGDPVRSATRRAAGWPRRVMRTSSPAATASNRRERWVLASWTPTDLVMDLVCHTDPFYLRSSSPYRRRRSLTEIVLKNVAAFVHLSHRIPNIGRTEFLALAVKRVSSTPKIRTRCRQVRRWRLRDVTRTSVNRGERLRWLLEMVPSTPQGSISRTIKQKQRRLRGAEIDKLVAGYLVGATVYELAEQFGVHRSTVSELLERRGVTRRFGPLSPAQVAMATSLYGEGLSLATVGQQLGCHATTVRDALAKVGVEIRPRNGWDRQTGSS